jgi:hypothetical protein
MVRTLLRKYGGMYQLLWRQDCSLWIFIRVGNSCTRPPRSLYYVAVTLTVETRWCSLLDPTSAMPSGSENFYWQWESARSVGYLRWSSWLSAYCIWLRGVIIITPVHINNLSPLSLSDLHKSLLYCWNIGPTRSTVIFPGHSRRSESILCFTAD